MPDYEVDSAELLRLAQLAREYSANRLDIPNLAHYADGICDTLQWLAGHPDMAGEPTFGAILEVDPAVKPRLIE